MTTTETTEAQRVTKRTIDRYDALGNKLTFRREELDAYLNLSKLFNDKLRSVKSQQDWLSNLEAQLDSQGPLSSDINQLEQQLRAMQVCHARFDLWNESMNIALTYVPRDARFSFVLMHFLVQVYSAFVVKVQIMHIFSSLKSMKTGAKERVEG